MDGPRPCPPQDARTRLCRGTGGQYIIDKHDSTAANLCPISYSKDAADIARPRRTPHADAGRRRLGAEQRVDGKLDPRRGGDRPRQKRRLVEAAPPQPPAVQRHRHQQYISLQDTSAGTQHLPGHHRRQMLAVTVLKTEQRRASRAAIDQRRPRTGIAWRLGQTLSTQRARATINLERQAATAAHGIGYELQQRPTIATIAPIGIDNGPTAGTSWWQHQIDQGLHRLEHLESLTDCRHSESHDQRRTL